MDYYALLDLVITLGHRLAMNGAETFRVEDSITLIMAAYGIDAEAFAITNCLTVSIKTESGKPMTRMRRIGAHGNDLDAVERYSNLSRRICSQKPDPLIALQWLKETDASLRHYRLPAYFLGNFCGAAGFAILFGASFWDCLISGFCGILVGLVNLAMDRLHANQFFRIIIASYLMSLPAYALAAFGVAGNADTVIIGALMLLVPGLLFTNALRDIINGDTNSGMNRIIQVFLIAIAIALGTGAAWGSVSALWQQPVSIPALVHPISIQLIGVFFGCVGFSILFNIHGPGGLLCALGGVITWAVYCIFWHFSGNSLLSNFAATLTAAIYAEIMARVRKYPAISYLVVSIFPLLPGAGIYYTINFFVQGDLNAFTVQGTQTISVAGVIAVGILIVSTSVRSLTEWRKKKKASV